MIDNKAQLKEHLEKGEDWEKMEMPVPGVFIVKIPATKTRPARLNLEFNPPKDDGSPMKKRGLFIGSTEMLIKFIETLSADKVYELIREMEQVNPDKEGAEPTKKPEM